VGVYWKTLEFWLFLVIAFGRFEANQLSVVPARFVRLPLASYLTCSLCTPILCAFSD
jgi:hypothetical protein